MNDHDRLEGYAAGSWPAAWWLASLLVFCSLANAEEVPVEKTVTKEAKAVADPMTAEVDVWVQNLSSDSYSERQAAMKNLRRSGTLGVTALAAAARGSNLETTARAIELLSQLYLSTDPNIAIAADEALESLGEHGPAIAVVRTQQALTTTLADNRRQHAITAIQRMGGNIVPIMRRDEEGEKEVPADLSEDGTIEHVILGKKWTGGLNGIKYLQRLPEIRALYITKSIPLTSEELDLLRAKLAGVRIEIRGAYLGIRNIPNGEVDKCVVDRVVPNSPADRGGLMAFDEITHLDGLPVTGFGSLTALLSEKHGGDIIYLEIHRGDDFLELEVTLSEW